MFGLIGHSVSRVSLSHLGGLGLWAMASGTQSSEMLTREQLLYVFDRFIYLTSQPGTLISFSRFVGLLFIWWIP